MNAQTAAIRRHADAIRRHAAELANELQALPPLTPEEDTVATMRAICTELADATTAHVCVELSVDRFYHSWSEEAKRWSDSTKWRIYISALNEFARGDTLEAARSAAMAMLQAAGKLPALPEPIMVRQATPEEDAAYWAEKQADRLDAKLAADLAQCEGQ